MVLFGLKIKVETTNSGGRDRTSATKSVHGVLPTSAKTECERRSRKKREADGVGVIDHKCSWWNLYSGKLGHRGNIVREMEAERARKDENSID